MPFDVRMNQRLTSLVEGLRKLRPGSSLIREAKRVQMRTGGIRRSDRIFGWTKTKVRAAFGTPLYAFLWTLLAGLGGLLAGWYLVPDEIKLWRLHLPLSLFNSPRRCGVFTNALASGGIRTGPLDRRHYLCL